MEGKTPHIDEYEFDPRSLFTEALIDFALQAITQQRAIDADPERKTGAGSLYKIDGGFFKIHLQAPATDRVFHGTHAGKETTSSQRPGLWVLIPVIEGVDELEDMVLEAEEIVVHVEVQGEEPLGFLVRNDYLGPLAPAYKTLADLQAYEPPSLEEQMLSAQSWFELLDEYALRTIVSSNAPTQSGAA